MKTIKTVILSLVTLASLSGVAFGAEKLKKEIDPAKKADIVALFQLDGSEENLKDTTRRMMEAFKVSVPNIPDEVWDELVDEFDFDEIQAEMIPVYDKYFTHEDIKEILAFKNSPVGKKFTSVQVNMVQDIMQIMMKRHAKIANKISELTERGMLN